MGQRLTYWIFLGAIGFVVYFMLYSSIAFNAGAPIKDSRSTVEGKTVELANQLGFTVDSLHLLATRTQHLNYYRQLKDSASARSTPRQLNSDSRNLTGWKINIGTKQEDNVVVSSSFVDIIDKVSRLTINYGPDGRVRRIEAHPQNPNPTFVAGDSLFSIATHIVRDILSYNLDNYKLNYVDVRDSVITRESALGERSLNLSENSVGNNTLFNWQAINPELEPAELSLELKPLIRESSTGSATTIRYGAAIEEFRALDQFEPEQLGFGHTINNATLIVSFGSLMLLILLVFFVGIKHINKGQVEWKRAMLILLTVGIGIFGWRIFYLLNTFEPFFNDTNTAVFVLNQLLLGGACGLYGALAYIGWEATARGQNHQHLHLLDAYWRKRFFFHETGESLLRGYAFGGILLGLFAVLIYLLDTVYYQADSQFGFAEPSMNPKLLTMNISAGINTLLVALGHVAVLISFMQAKLKKTWLLYGAGMIITGLLFAGSASLVGVVGSIWQDIFIYSVIGAVVIYVYTTTGLISFSSGWWVFVVILMIMPYWGSESLDVAYVAWIQLSILSLPLIYGFIAYRYGNSVTELGGYIPEYQERIANHLRVEKEIEIARESQFKLMPLQPPSIPGVDVYGFFMPSFEVGGDYFDYVIGRNGTPEKQILTMTIVDVSGKAMKAAMHAVFTSGLLLSRLHRDAPESILQEVSPTLFSRTDPKTFITCIIAQYNPEDMALKIANAGHCLPILKRNGKAEFIKTPDPKYPLGIKQDVCYRSMEMNLQPGDFLLLYSDGLPEAVDPKGNRFGFNSLISMVESLDTGKPSNEISLDIKRRVQKFSDYQLADDTTIICMKV